MPSTDLYPSPHSKLLSFNNLGLQTDSGLICFNELDRFLPNLLHGLPGVTKTVHIMTKTVHIMTKTVYIMTKTVYIMTKNSTS